MPMRSRIPASNLQQPTSNNLLIRAIRVIRGSFLLLITSLVLLTCASSAAAADRPNVLFIAVDDLNDWVGPLGGHPQVRTPHMDRMAARGTVFTNAHCQ